MCLRATGLVVAKHTGLMWELSGCELHKLSIYRQKLAATFADEFCQIILKFKAGAIFGFMERFTSRYGLKDAITAVPQTSNGQMTRLVRDVALHLNIPVLRTAGSPVSLTRRCTDFACSLQRLRRQL